MGINEMIKNAKSIDPLPDIDPAQKKIAMLKGKFAALILNKRYELGMNQTDFAKFLGVSQTMVSRWEDGEYNFTLEKVGEISSKLGLEMDLTILNSSTNSLPSNVTVYYSKIPIYTISESFSKKRLSYLCGSCGQEILQYS